MPNTINLTKGQKAVIDSTDYKYVGIHKWCAVGGYTKNGVMLWRAGRRNPKNGRIQLMHRFIMKPRKGQTVDHIDGNQLNNQRKNLRVCSHMRNCWNRQKYKNGSASSKYMGVSFDTSRKLWVSQATKNYKHIFIGRFKSELLAAKAYDKMAKKIFGIYANTNFK